MSRSTPKIQTIIIRKGLRHRALLSLSKKIAAGELFRQELLRPAPLAARAEKGSGPSDNSTKGFFDGLGKPFFDARSILFLNGGSS